LDVQMIEALTEARPRRSYTAHPSVAVSSSGSLCGTTPGLDATHTREICVGDCPDIGRGKLHQRLRRPRRAHELHFESGVRVDMHDGAEIAAPKSVLRHVTFKNNHIKFTKAHEALPG
jgi:hypothetical protein